MGASAYFIFMNDKEMSGFKRFHLLRIFILVNFYYFMLQQYLQRIQLVYDPKNYIEV